MTEIEARKIIAEKLKTTVDELKIARGRLLTDAGALLEAICIVRSIEQAAHAATCREWQDVCTAHLATIVDHRSVITELRRQLANAQLRATICDPMGEDGNL